ncbi:MAG: site-2 protease family protein [Balneolales bacterium]
MKKYGISFGGLRITVDPLLPLVVILMAWMLSERYFPQIMFTPAASVYWTMGIISSLFLTFSIFIHELGHALAAWRLRLPLERIHLYLFGGMAELKRRPVRPVEELIIALSGPLASFVFAAFAWGITAFVYTGRSEIALVLQYVFYMNVLLGGFNLLPVFPLDGGRALRAILWHVNRYFYRASILTYYTSLVIIFLMMLCAVALAIIYGFSTAFWMAILAGYLWYTAYSGRDELIYHPGFDDLIFRVGENDTPALIIRRINRMDSHYLPDAIIPVMKDGKLVSVVIGKELKKIPEQGEELDHLYRPVENGFYVDVTDESTYKLGVRLKAEFLPVLRNGLVTGMSDAHEIRFWLLQQEHGSSNRNQIHSNTLRL